MIFEVIKSEENEKWDGIVKSFKNHDVYYLNGYARAFQSHGDGEPLLFYFDNGDTRAVNVVMKRVIAGYKYFDLSTPYGYGGFIVEGGGGHKFIGDKYISWCRENNIVSEYVRLHPLLNNFTNPANIYETNFIGDTVCMDISNTDKILNNMASRSRNEIKKAQKSGLCVRWGREGRLIDEFMDIYNSTMDKNNAAGYYYFKRPFYEIILNGLKDNSLFFYTESDGEIIAVSVILFCNGKMHYHLSGSKNQFRYLAPTNLLLYEAARWGSANGYKEFHLGGGRGARQDSLYVFKKSFSRTGDKKFYTGKAVFNKEIYKNLVDIRKKEPDFDPETNYFPAYRG